MANLQELKERECLHDNWHDREAISKIQTMRNFEEKIIQFPQQNIRKISFTQKFCKIYFIQKRDGDKLIE